MIVIGNPGLVSTEHGSRAAGAAASVALAAREAGAEVQLVGKVGEDADGEAVLLDLAKSRIGHVAVLRDPRLTTSHFDEPPDEATDFDEVDDPDRPNPPLSEVIDLDAADIELALRYLPDYRVIVVAEPLNDAALGGVVAAAGWSSAALVVVTPPGSTPSTAIPSTATVLEATTDAADPAFAAMVGRYAAALDRGEDAAAAFEHATNQAGWSAAGAASAAEPAGGASS